MRLLWKIKNCKFAMKFLGSTIARASRFLGIRKPPKESEISANVNPSPEFLEPRIPTHSNVSAFIGHAPSFVAIILRASGLAKIAAAIVETVSVAVVNLHGRMGFKYFSMHQQNLPFGPSDGVVDFLEPQNAPIKFIECRKISRADKGNLAARQWDKAVRLVLRLGYRGSFDSVSHVPIPNGSLLTAAFYRRLVPITFLFVSCGMAIPSYAQSTLTPNVMFQLPAYQSVNWQVPIDWNFNVLDMLLGGYTTLPTGATPSITQSTTWITANTGATTITNFVDGFPGQTLHLVCGAGDTFTTLANATNIAVQSGWTCASNQSITLNLIGVVWTETGRAGTSGGGGSGNFGGTNVQSGTSYTALSGDAGALIAFTSGAPAILTLPATPPSATWAIQVEAVGAGGVTINRNGLLIDGAAANLTLTQNQGVIINTNGANYYTQRGIGGASGGSTPCTTTALSIQYNNAGTFGCEPDLTFSSPHTLLSGAAGIYNFANAAEFDLPVNAGQILFAGLGGAVTGTPLMQWDSTGNFLNMSAPLNFTYSYSDPIASLDSAIVAETFPVNFTTNLYQTGIASLIHAQNVISLGEYNHDDEGFLAGIYSNVDFSLGGNTLPYVMGIESAIAFGDNSTFTHVMNFNSDAIFDNASGSASNVPNFYHFRANTPTDVDSVAPNTITNDYGLYIDPQQGGTGVTIANSVGVYIADQGLGKAIVVAGGESDFQNVVISGSCTGCGGGGGGSLSGMTAGQIPVAATATTVTSSIATIGTGNIVRATSPTLVTPNLGTPSILNLASASNLQCGALPAFTGDTTTSAGNCTTTTAKINGTPFPASAAVIGSNGSAQPVGQTATTVTAFLNQFSTTLQGLAPASGGGTTNFLRADGVWTAPGGSGTVNSGTQFAFGYYATSTSAISSGPPPPAVDGNYNCGYVVTSSVAVAPTCPLEGLQSRTEVSSSDTVLYSDNNQPIEYQGSAAVAVSLPTPTSLNNPQFWTIIDNLTTGTNTAVTVTPATFTINGNSTLVIPQNSSCRVAINPGASNDWLPVCSPNATAGIFTNYGNQPVYGMGVVPVVAPSFDQVGVSTANSGTPQTIYTTPAAGFYELDMYVNQNAGCATVGSGDLTADVEWTDAEHARNQTWDNYTPVTSPTNSSYGTNEIWIYAASGSVISATNTYVACSSGSWTYDVHYRVKRIS